MYRGLTSLRVCSGLHMNLYRNICVLRDRTSDIILHHRVTTGSLRNKENEQETMSVMEVRLSYDFKVSQKQIQTPNSNEVFHTLLVRYSHPWPGPMLPNECLTVSRIHTCSPPVPTSSCTSGHGPGVDGEVLGCSPENLLMGFSPRLSLQQFFLCVREVELWSRFKRSLVFSKKW